MFQFTRSMLYYPMYSDSNIIRLRIMGFPIRRSPDRSLLDGSPRLIAAYHVLHRLLSPRHPPYALTNLIFYYAMKFSKNNILKELSLYSFRTK